MSGVQHHAANLEYRVADKACMLQAKMQAICRGGQHGASMSRLGHYTYGLHTKEISEYDL